MLDSTQTIQNRQAMVDALNASGLISNSNGVFYNTFIEVRVYS